VDIGLLLLRIGFGGALALQGRAKLTRTGRVGTAEFFGAMGFAPAGPLAVVAGLTELGTGLLFVVGAGMPLAAAGAAGVLVSAAAVSWRNGYWNTSGGAEYALVSLVAAAALAFTGAGAISVDGALDHARWGAGPATVAIAVGVATALPLLVRRARTLAAGRTSSSVPAAA